MIATKTMVNHLNWIIAIHVIFAGLEIGINRKKPKLKTKSKLKPKKLDIGIIILKKPVYKIKNKTKFVSIGFKP